MESRRSFTRRTLLRGGSAAAIATVVGTPSGVGWASGRPSGRGGRRTLITGGYVLTMDRALGDLPCGDVLIEGDRIVQVGTRIRVRPGSRVDTIDATGMIVMPGLVDNHRHLWESLIRGYSANHTFGQYFSQVLFGISPKMRPEDVFVGNLLGAYEALDSGITTILDWSHATNTREHALAAIEGLRRARCRAVFAYGSPAANSGRPDSPPTPDDVRAAHAALANDPLLTLAIGAANPETSDFGRVAADIALARELGVRVTMHAFGTARPSAPERLNAAGLMGSDLTFIHCNSFTPGDFALVAEHGAHISSSPEVEMQMGLGAAPLTGMLAGGVNPTVSVDIVPAVGGELFSQLRFLLQVQRMLDYEAALQSNRTITSLPVSTRDVLSYVTTNAAASLGLEDEIGSLRPGKQADIILVNVLDLNLFLSEPSAALVSSAHPGNVDTVLVAGRVVKRNKRLVDVDLRRLRSQAQAASRRLLKA